MQSVDSSAMRVKVFPLLMSCTRSSLRAGETTWVIILVHFVMCNLSFFQVTLTAACPPPPQISPTWSTVGIAEWHAIHTAKHISASLTSLEIVGIFIVNTGLVELGAVSLPVRSFPSACFTRTDFLGFSVFLQSLQNASRLSPVAFLSQNCHRLPF